LLLFHLLNPLDLLLAEENRLKEAANYLEKAVFIIQTNPRIFYNCGLCLQHLGLQDETEAAYFKGIGHL
jgi:hypothetical protein